MHDAKVYLVLGCNGRSLDGFVFCSKAESRILQITPHLEKAKEMVQYLKALNLFEVTMKDYNAVRNSIFRIQDNYYQKLKPIWNEKYFRMLEQFTIMHKECGIFLKIEVE